jgi:hypothetical protein
MGKNKFVPHSPCFLADLGETEHKKVPTWCHWEAESCLKMGAVKAIFYSRVLMYFWSLFLYLVADLGGIRFRRSAYNAFERLQVSWKLVQKSSTYLYGLEWNFACIFYIFRSTLIQYIVEQLHIVVLGSCEFCENRLTERHTLLCGINDFLFTVLYIYCPVWIKFGVMDLHAMLLSTSEFHENWRTGCTSMGINEIPFTHVLRNRMIFWKQRAPWWC